MSNVVYVKEFENGKKYVGVTGSFNRRMKEHKRASEKDKPKSLVHRAMKKHNHYTEIIFESNDYDEVLTMEVIVIQNFKDIGYELYNITIGGEGTKGNTQTKEARLKIGISSRARAGIKRNGSSKPKEHYILNAVKRSDFKNKCKKQDWVFEDFEEIDSGEKYSTHRRYYYKSLS